MTQKDIFDIALKQSAADCSCSPEDFLRTEHVVTEARPNPSARRDRPNPPLCSAHYRCFETPYIYELNKALEKFGMRVYKAHSAFLPDLEAVFGADLSCPYETRLLHPEDFTDLYVPAWGNALCEDRKQLDMLGAGAYDGGKLIGLAGCSADGDEMWQIGIDVLPEYRRAIFEHDKVPFYGAAWSNIRSLKNAFRCGFRPAWAEMSIEEI